MKKTYWYCPRDYMGQRTGEKSVNNGYKDIEYIRKDAVIEILATLKRSMANDTSYFALGATDAANILIDKINSM